MRAQHLKGTVAVCGLRMSGGGAAEDRHAGRLLAMQRRRRQARAWVNGMVWARRQAHAPQVPGGGRISLPRPHWQGLKGDGRCAVVSRTDDAGWLGGAPTPGTICLRVGCPWR